MNKNLINDLDNDELPRNLENYKKIKLKKLSMGMRIGWYFKEDLEFWKEEKFSIKNRRLNMPYSGILIPKDDIERHSNYEPDDLIIVMDNYPSEKENPRTTFIALKRLLDNEDLIEIIEQK